MRLAARLLAGSLSALAILLATGVVPAAVPSSPGGGGATAEAAEADADAGTLPLQVTITSLSPGSITVNRPVTVRGTITNPGTTPWSLTNVYLLISSTPAADETGLETFAETPDSGLFGTGIYDTQYLTAVGTISAHASKAFAVTVPYDRLPISGAVGVYRVGVRVVSTNAGIRNVDGAPQASTLLPLLATKQSSIVATPTVTVVPVTAPVARLPDGTFADDSLAALVSTGHQLSDLLDWVANAPPDTLQLVVDPALLSAVSDMAQGYRVKAPGTIIATQRPLHTLPTRPGSGRVAAQLWLALFKNIEQSQYVLVMPWGNPAGDALVAAGLPGPLQSALGASAGYVAGHRGAFGVAGWLPGGNLSQAALDVLRAAHPSAMIASSRSLPGLGSTSPAVVEVGSGASAFPLLVTSAQIAGITTVATTSALQVRQRLLAEATVRAIGDQPGTVEAFALPAGWDPGPVTTAAPFAAAFDLPVLRADSAIAALLQPGPTYHGRVRALPTRLRPPVLDAIRALRVQGGNLDAILSPSTSAHVAFQHAFAMAGSQAWVHEPLLGSRLTLRQTAVDAAALSRVVLTGPPFVAMSSNSGRFPLTVTNGLDKPVTLHLLVVPDDKALTVHRLDPIQVAAGGRRDIQIETDATGSGVTSVRARLATPHNVSFGKPWIFDVRTTEIGLVIWVVMGVGGAVLFGAAALRVVRRVRGRQWSRR